MAAMTLAGNSLLVLLAWATGPRFAQAGAGDVVMESDAPKAPAGWEVVGPSPKDKSIELTFAVKQQGLRELHDRLMQVSVPSSPLYGQHLSNEEVQALTAPDPSHFEAVTEFLASFGASPSTMTPNGDFISVVVPVETAEKMLSTEYVQLRHNEAGVERVHTPTGYKLPAKVAAAVDFVAPTVHVPGVAGPGKNGSPGASSYNSPKNLRKLYRVDREGSAPANKMAVTAFLGQEYSDSSLQKFWDMFCSGIKCGKGSVKLVGDATTGNPGVEAMLDIETITGVAGNVEAEFWGFAAREEPFLKWLMEVSSTSDEDVPKIFSTSYGGDEGSWSYTAAQRLNAEFQKAGARGISLLFASGDEGANCKSGKFVPEGPGSSPYVTAVGGTKAAASWPSPGPDSETAVGLSSGGFSKYWAMPSWQQDAVGQYLKQEGLPPASRGYNTSGRAYPDIAAQASNYFVYAGGPEPGVAGTSCASPAAAGIFALLNDLRLQSGNSTLGFLNPFIYSHAESFTDITTGSNKGCGFFSQGWPAKQGWDAVTGVGTPNFALLAKAVAGLPAGRQTSAASALYA